MENETKSILTRELVEEELRFYNKEDFRSSLAPCALFGLPVFLIVFACFCAIFAIVESIWARLLLYCLLCTVLSIPAKKTFLPLIKNWKEKKALERGDFCIVTRKLTKKSVNTNNHKSTELLHFSGFKEIEAWHEVFANAHEGDEFYLVHYRKQNSVKLAYPAKMYEYRER